MILRLLKRILFVTTIITSAISLSEQSALAAKPEAPPSAQQLRITEVSVDYTNNYILIKGEYLDNGYYPEPIVSLGGYALDISSFNSSEIVALLPVGYQAGDYLLTVSTGDFVIHEDEYDLTVDYTSLAAEEAARIAADEYILENSIQRSELDDETAARIAADNEILAASVQQSELDAEETARIATINTEHLHHVDGDAVLQVNLNTEEASRTASDSQLQFNIDAEEAARVAAINTEHQHHIDGDAAEAAARQAGDNAIQNQINTIQVAPGSFTPPTISHDAPLIQYGDQALVINVSITDDFEIGYYALRDSREPVTDDTVYPLPGTSQVDFAMEKQLVDGINSYLVVAADVAGNMSKALIEIEYTCADCDGDGFTPPDDCNDGNPDIYPGAQEVCNELDDNCDGLIDNDCINRACTDSEINSLETCLSTCEDDFTSCYFDCAGNLSGECSQAVLLLGTCSFSAGCLEQASSTDTALASRCAYESCPDQWGPVFGNFIPPACVEGETRSCGTNAGTCQTGIETCVSAEWSECVGAVDPEPEICDGLDNDCDGVTDNAPDADLYFPDNDNDGFGSEGGVYLCQPMPGYVTNESDCEDENPGINPAAEEVCDGLDNNCNGRIDEACTNP